MYGNYQDFHFDKNKLIKNSNTQYFILGFIILLLLIINIGQKNAYDNFYQKNFNDNMIHQKAINKINDENRIIYAELEREKELFNYVDSVNAQLINKINQQENILTELKSKYEKASNHSRNFNADSIRQYFADIKE